MQKIRNPKYLMSSISVRKYANTCSIINVALDRPPKSSVFQRVLYIIIYTHLYKNFLR